MKKLLGFTALPLGIMGVLAMTSCSSTDQVSSTLETEAAKFKNSVEAKDKNLNAAEAAAKIVATETPAQRLAALKTIAKTIPNLANGFTMEVDSAIVSEKDSKSVEVEIIITEAASSKTQTVFLTITGFLEASKMEVEVSKFNAPVDAKDKTITAAEAAAKIVATDTAALKLAALETIAKTIPNLANDFTMVVNSAEVNKEDTNQVDVSITITETLTSKTALVTLMIEGFPTSKDLLDLELSLFTPKEMLEDYLASSMVNILNSSTITSANKLSLLTQAVKDFPKFNQTKYTLGLGKAKVVGEVLNDATEIQVKITLTSKEEPTLTRTIDWTITKFLTYIEFQATIFKTPGTTTKPVLSASDAIDILNRNLNETALQALVKWPPDGFNLLDFNVVISGAIPVTEELGAIIVNFTINYKTPASAAQQNQKPIAIAWKITGFKTV